jgi:hypothetical protein
MADQHVIICLLVKELKMTSAQELAITYKRDTVAMRDHLKLIGISDCALLGGVFRAQRSSDYEEEVDGDEGLVTALNVCLKSLL